MGNTRFLLPSPSAEEFGAYRSARGKSAETVEPRVVAPPEELTQFDGAAAAEAAGKNFGKEALTPGFDVGEFRFPRDAAEQPGVAEPAAGRHHAGSAGGGGEGAGLLRTPEIAVDDAGNGAEVGDGDLRSAEEARTLPSVGAYPSETVRK